MRRHLFFLTLQLVATVCLIGSVERAAAQHSPSGVVLAELYPPVYPPLARQAHISGDVRILVGIRRDGSVVSAELISGHQMLKSAALESVQKSTFECRGCAEEVTSYSLTYTFSLRDDVDCGGRRLRRSAKCLYLWRCGDWRSLPSPSRRPEVTQSENHITLLVDSACVETSSTSSAGG